jgi:hypothetical protein
VKARLSAGRLPGPGVPPAGSWSPRADILPDFERIVTSTASLETIVLRQDVYPLVATLLAGQGFVHQASADGYRIVWR